MSELIKKLIKYLTQTIQRVDIPRTVKGLSSIRFTTKNSVIGRTHYLKHRYNLTSNFETLMQVDMTNTMTGEKSIRRIYVGHNDLRTPGELEELIINALATDSPDQEVTNSMPIYGRESARVLVSRAEKLYK